MDNLLMQKFAGCLLGKLNDLGRSINGIWVICVNTFPFHVVVFA